MRRRQRNRYLPEVALPAKPRAGFIPNIDDTEPDTELWQIWLRRDDGDGYDEKRATERHLKMAGYVQKKKKGKGKGRGKGKY